MKRAPQLTQSHHQVENDPAEGLPGARPKTWSLFRPELAKTAGYIARIYKKLAKTAGYIKSWSAQLRLAS